MSKDSGKQEARVLPVTSSSPWLGKLGAPKLVLAGATAKKAEPPLPGPTAPGIVENGNVAFWRDGNTLFFAVDISPETLAVCEAPVSTKTGKASRRKLVAQVKGPSQFEAYSLGGGFRCNLWLGADKA